ncbi:MAG: hypothetical protein M0Z59_03070 [Nitrospiraceae bacterium]|nr:hypothetical protein [Nitrospiraceae bacterium]
MVYAGLAAACLIGFVAGVLVERRNRAHMESAIGDIKQGVRKLGGGSGK